MPTEKGFKEFVKVGPEDVPAVEANLSESDHFRRTGHGEYEGPGMTVNVMYGSDEASVEYEIDGGLPSVPGMEYTEETENAVTEIFDGVPGVSDNEEFQREIAYKAGNAYRAVRAAAD